jgi:RNA polymerase sigma factor (TIGR02999 family)
MKKDSPADITALLVAWGKGDQEAFTALVPLVDRELHQLAAHYMAGERDGHLLQPTALVNEAFLRLVDWKNVEWAERAHFFAMAATMMRRVLVDYARARGREKRGRGAATVPLSAADGIPLPDVSDVTALDAALTELERIAPRQSRVIELRYFGGLSLDETAVALEVSVGTVRRDWSLARAWLFRELSRRETR